MPGRYVLDTSVVVPLLRGEPEVSRRFESAQELLLPATVLGELCFGALRSSAPATSLLELAQAASRCTLIACDEAVARRYADVRFLLMRKGRPLPENDLWIAACALVHGVPLVTRDAHFDQVDGLTVEMW